MASINKKIVQPETITLLDRGCEFQGKLSFEGVVRIDGSFQGEIFSQDHLIIGEGAKVEATIQVGKLEVGGHFKGKIIARDELVVHSTGRIEGEVETKELEAHHGCIFDGSLRMSGMRDAGIRPGTTSLVPLGEKGSQSAS